MSELFQTGQHPDADQLSAFVEHALPTHEFQKTLAHLAICADCRTIVSLSLPPAEELPQLRPLPMRTPWFSGWNLAWPAAIAVAATTLIVVHISHGGRATTLSAPTMQVAASTPPAAPAPQQVVPTAPVLARAPLATHGIRPARVSAQPGRTTTPIDLQLETGEVAPTKSSENNEVVANVPGSGISGTISDPSGRVVPKATVTATNTYSGVQTSTVTDSAGRYTFEPVQPGRYNVEVAAIGFRRLLQENVAVDNASVVGLPLKLAVGSEDTTITITDAPPFLETTDATLGGSINNELYTNLPLSMAGAPRDPTAFQYLMPGVQEGPQVQSSGGVQQGIYGGTGQTNLNQNYIEGMPKTSIPAHPLPSGLAALSMVAAGHLQLALDAGNALFLSSDDGLHWKSVPPQWKGRAVSVHLTTPPPATVPAPQNTSDAPLVQAPAAAPTRPSGPASRSGQSASTASVASPSSTRDSAARPRSSAATLFELITDTDEHWMSSDGLVWTRDVAVGK